MRGLCLLPAALLVATAPAASDLKAVLLSRYAVVTRALQTQNMEGVRALLTSDFRAIAPDGKSIGRDKILQQFEFQSRTAVRLTWDRKITDLQRTGSTAIATVTGHLSAYTPRTPSHHIDLTAATKDTWQNVRGKWLLSKSQLLWSKFLFDGKATKAGIAGAP